MSERKGEIRRESVAFQNLDIPKNLKNEKQKFEM